MPANVPSRPSIERTTALTQDILAVLLVRDEPALTTQALHEAVGGVEVKIATFEAAVRALKLDGIIANTVAPGRGNPLLRRLVDFEGAARVLALPISGRSHGRSGERRNPLTAEEVANHVLRHLRATVAAEAHAAEPVPQPVIVNGLRHEHNGTSSAAVRGGQATAALYGHRPPLIRAGALDAARLVASRCYGRSPEVALGVTEAR